MNRKKISLFSIFTVGMLLLLFFQNCSRGVNIALVDSPSVGSPASSDSSSNLDSTYSPLNNDLIIESGALATNKKILNVELKNPTRDYKKMRFIVQCASQNNAIDSASWVDYSPKFQADLDNCFSSDGTLDGQKNIIAEYTVDSENKDNANGSINLDTLSPIGEPLQQLLNGPQNISIQKGDKFEIEFEAQDSIGNGYSSGIDPNKGLRIGWSETSDCLDENIVEYSESDFTAYSTREIFIWPKDDPQDSFYICVFVRDLAGNVGVIKSAPMPQCYLSQVKRKVKILFVVDTSGSNVEYSSGASYCIPQYQTCSPPSDPHKLFRSQSIELFFNKYRSLSNFQWGFLTFSGFSANSLVQSNNSKSAYFSDASAMSSAISRFKNIEDADGTPYASALDTAKIAISSDADLALTGNDAPIYYVIFLSDGYPSSGDADVTKLNQKVSALINLASNNRIVFSTVYYSSETVPLTSAAPSLLRSMANTGYGQFISVNSSSTESIDIDDLIQVPVGNCK